MQLYDVDAGKPTTACFFIYNMTGSEHLMLRISPLNRTSGFMEATFL